MMLISLIYFSAIVRHHAGYCAGWSFPVCPLSLPQVTIIFHLQSSFYQPAHQYRAAETSSNLTNIPLQCSFPASSWTSCTLTRFGGAGGNSIKIQTHDQLRNLSHRNVMSLNYRCTEGEAATATDMDPRICFCDTTNEHHHKRHRISIQNCPIIQNLHKTSKFKTLLSKDHTFTIAATATSNIDHNLRNSICCSLYC